jgi:SWI/SNF-related matrix-associated actin-dependent regulator 1 of chromatin subfamily A
VPILASIDDGEAVLSFPYDERVRSLLRAIPGRRWEPRERTWRIPLDPDRAEALSRLLGDQPQEPQISKDLARALERRRRRRGADCLLDLARPDQDWWLSFATDIAPQVVGELLEHPDSYSLPAIGRALIPVDDRTARLVAKLRERDSALKLTSEAEGALSELALESAAAPRLSTLTHEVELRRDRRGQHWILFAPEQALLARTLAQKASLRPLDGPAGTLGIAANENEGMAIAELLGLLEPSKVDPRLERWIARASKWGGTIEVAGPSHRPVFLLLGEPARLPVAVRERARSVPGGLSIPLNLENWEAIEGLDGYASEAAKRCVEALRAGRPIPAAVLERSRVHDQDTFVLAPGHEPKLLEDFAALPGALPNRPARKAEHEHSLLPAISADPFCVPQLDALLAERKIWVDPDALELLQEIRESHAHGAGLVELSCATDAAVRVEGLAGELKPFQRAGVNYLLSQRRAFLADEQGLGKTIEALATLQADGAFPAIVVSPASLKLNWMRETERWLPDREVRILSGSGATSRHAAADVTIVNYDILSARYEELAALSPRALVLDESHYCKNAAAKRTQAVQRLSATIGQDGLVLALTGTPVMNRPAELISQLRILGRLTDFGSGAQFGRRFRGPDAHMRLHWHLRARCFVRRVKADVLPQLPAKRRSVVPVELTNEAEYRLAERDVIAWLRSQPLDLRELDAKVAAALRAERLVRLNALKLLAARGKLHGALAWIHDFLCSRERLVVFAHHREVQRALLERFPDALHILGSDSHQARDQALEAFQARDAEQNRLIVCSIEVAGQGLTLTRSSNVAFLELDWTPAKHDQAEDRCHRLGQQDAVNAWYLLAADTVDETIAALLESKRAIIGAVTDGLEHDEEGVIDALVRELRGEPYRHLRIAA